jgi:lactate permease
MFHQTTDPILDSLVLSAVCAALPLLLLFVLLGVFRVAAHKAALAGLGLAVLLATLGWRMPIDQTLSATAEGAFYGLFPILWILVNALWIYRVTLATPWFDVLGRTIRSISDDLRILAILIAFCFGSLLEALAGFGAPVAISAAMLMVAGMKPLKSALVSLLANTAPVAFGAMAAPIVALSGVTSLPLDDLASMIGRQTPFIALLIPLLLVFMVDGRRGVRQTWPVALLAGAVFAVAKFVTSNYIAVELTDVVAAVMTVAAVLVMLRFWQPVQVVGISEPAEADVREPDDAGSQTPVPDAVRTADAPEAAVAPAAVAPGTAGAPATASETTETSPTAVETTVVGTAAVATTVTDTAATERPAPREIWLAVAPYLIIMAVFSIAQVPIVKSWLADAGRVTFRWPGLDVVDAEGKPVGAQDFTLDHLKATGTLLLISGLITMALYRVSVRRGMQIYGETVSQLRWTIVTVTAVLGLSFAMNLSGQTTTLGAALASTGGFFAVLSPLIGWIGVALTGSDTSSNALFGQLQVTAANQAGLSPVLMASTNSSAGVLGKMLSLQNLAVAAAAVGLQGAESTLFRKLLGWSLGLLVLVTVLVLLQATPVLSWMVP